VNRLTPDPAAAAAPFVAVSDLMVPEAGRAAVVAAFGHRLGAVDSWPGFQGLQVWADRSDPTALVMVSWWDSQEAFAAYMGSADHRRSHERIPTGANRPRPKGFRRYQVIAE
jgi:heme oxygenase (mycobilin-producing)